MKKAKLILTIFLIILCWLLLKGCSTTISEKSNDKNVPILDISNVQVEIGDYNVTSTPIGIGEYSIESNYNYNAELSINVVKNTNTPWCGAVTVEWELFDVNGKSIGKSVGKSGNLLMGKSAAVAVSFNVNDIGKITYNQKEIQKIVLTSVSEEDDLHNFLISNFINKKNSLNNYLDEGNLEMFYTTLESVRQEYSREEFPDQNQELDEMEIKAKSLGENQNLKPELTIKNETSDNTPKQLTKEQTTQKAETSGKVKYKKFRNDYTLSKGEKVIIGGAIGMLEMSDNIEDSNMAMLLDDEWYILNITGDTGYLYRDAIEESGLNIGSYVAIAGEFVEYWESSNGTLCKVLNIEWFTPIHFMEGENMYVELPSPNGKSLYSWDIEL